MVAPRPRQEVTLTGRTRVRLGWFGRLLLQVEERVQTFEPWWPRARHPFMHPVGGYQPLPSPPEPIATWHRWRDATIGDALHRGLRMGEGGLPPQLCARPPRDAPPNVNPPAPAHRPPVPPRPPREP